jgi:hypothetical protein
MLRQWTQPDPGLGGQTGVSSGLAIGSGGVPARLAISGSTPEQVCVSKTNAAWNRLRQDAFPHWERAPREISSNPPSLHRHKGAQRNVPLSSSALVLCGRRRSGRARPWGRSRSWCRRGCPSGRRGRGYSWTRNWYLEAVCPPRMNLKDPGERHCGRCARGADHYR